MTPSNTRLFQPGTLADALRAAQGRPSEHVNDPLVDRLATALVLPSAPGGTIDFDDEDGDDELDLPMLIQGHRPTAIVPMPPIKARGKEGRAALVGFGLGIALLVPLGVVMSNRLPEPVVAQADSSASSLLHAVMPTTIVTDEAGIRTTRRATQAVQPVAAEPITPTPAPAPVVEAVEIKTAAVLPPPVAPLPPVAPPAPDHLAEAATLLGQGDIAAARSRIQDAGLDGNPAAVLALAETFDPNMLAAWGIRGAHADAERARLLYARALSQGLSKARQRLDALE